MKKIIVTTDLSEESKKAFGPAKELARLTGASVKLLCVVEDPAQALAAYSMDFVPVPMPNLRDELVNKATDELHSLAKTHFADVTRDSQIVVASTSIAHEIVDISKKSGADLVVMATHGRTGVRRLLIGSVAERVVRESSCPVLVIPVRG